MSNKLVTLVAFGSLALVLGSACGSSSSNPDDGTSGGTSGTSGGTSGDGTSGTGTSGTIGTSGGTSGGADSGLGACGATTESAKQLPVDILVMLDASGSMMEQTGAGGTGPTKWASVKSALTAFIGDPKSAGLGVGLQIFPIEHPGSPASCSSNAQCSVGGVSLGRCFLKACHPPTASTPITSCDSAADCPGGAACYPFGACPGGLGNCLVGDPTYGAMSDRQVPGDHLLHLRRHRVRRCGLQPGEGPDRAAARQRGDAHLDDQRHAQPGAERAHADLGRGDRAAYRSRRHMRRRTPVTASSSSSRRTDSRRAARRWTSRASPRSRPEA